MKTKPEKPVVFACPAHPEYKQVSFGSVKVGEEFTLPGDPDEVEYKKINARGGRRSSDRMFFLFLEEEKVEPIRSY